MIILSFFLNAFLGSSSKPFQIHSISDVMIPDDCKEHVSQDVLASLVYIENKKKERLCDGAIKSRGLHIAVFLASCIDEKVKKSKNKTDKYAKYTIITRSVTTPSVVERHSISNISEATGSTLQYMDRWKPFKNVFVSRLFMQNLYSVQFHSMFKRYFRIKQALYQPDHMTK